VPIFQKGNIAVEFTPQQRIRFSALMREARAKRGETQVQVADGMSAMFKTTVSQAFISGIEKGPYEGMRFIDLIQIIQYYSLSLQTVIDILGLQAAPVDVDSMSLPLNNVLIQATTELDEAQQSQLAEILQIVMNGIKA